MRFLVTGVAGFLGSFLTEELLTEGHEVLGVDNLITGQKSNLDKCLEFKRFEFLRHDITFPLYVEVDGIFNLACPASPVKYQQDPVQTFKTSVIGSINLLGIAKRLQIPILQASTSEIYGDPKISPQTEDYWGNTNPIGIRACYDEGKRAAETAFSDYRRQYKIDTKIARIFNTFGPRMSTDDGRVVSNFIVQALLGQDITIYGDGMQTRSFCYVTDTVRALNRFMKSAGDGLPINIGNPEEISVITLATEIIKLTNSNSKIVYKKLPGDDPSQRKPSIERASSLLGWTPQVSRISGLQLTINYFQQILKF